MEGEGPSKKIPSNIFRFDKGSSISNSSCGIVPLYGVLVFVARMEDSSVTPAGYSRPRLSLQHGQEAAAHPAISITRVVRVLYARIRIYLIRDVATVESSGKAIQRKRISGERRRRRRSSRCQGEVER